MNQIEMNGYKRVSKRTALKLYKDNTIIRIVPYKYGPDNMYITYYDISKEYARQHFAVELETKTDIQMFEMFVNSFTFYNCNYETGYYCAYYINI